MQLRYYQQKSIDCIKDNFNGLLVLPTGSGKSLIVAGIARDYPTENILILQPSKEILEQNYAKILNFVDDPEEAGIYSASLNQKNIRRVTLATIGSIGIYEDFYKFGIIIIDEAHYVNTKTCSIEQVLEAKGV